MSPLRRLALGLSVLVLLAGVATAAYAAGQQRSPGPPSPTDITTAPPTTPLATQPEPEAAREPAPTTTRLATTGPIKLVVGKYCAAMHALRNGVRRGRRARTGTGPTGGLRPRLPR
jgi:hypothetical protein